MNDFCKDHSEVVQCLGRIEERQKIFVETFKDVATKVDTLVKNGVEKEATTKAVERERRWIHWLLVSAGGAAVVIIVQTYLPIILRTIVEVLTK